MVENDELEKFTLEEYIAYLKAPQWVKDGCTDEADYHSSTCAKVKAWADESEKAFEFEKAVWEICYDQIENTSKKAIKSGIVAEDHIAQAKIPILKNTMLDDVASLYSGNYAPVLKHLSPQVQAMIGLANRYMQIELTMNKWPMLKFDLGLDGFVCALWVAKIYTDDEEPGPFGADERIVIDRIDPRNCCFDPKATRKEWSKMDYFIVKEDMDIGVCRNRFKDRAGLIDENLAEPGEGKDRFKISTIVSTPGARKWDQMAERKRIQVKECWLHDERMQFRAHEVLNEETQKYEVEVDEDGFVVGSWERAYPYGRMIVTAADKVVLRDCPNPYWHKGLPYVFADLEPTTRLLTVGKAASILGIERKVNDMESRVHSYAQSEIERPMQADMGALPSNIAWYKTTGQSRAILVMQSGKQFVRPQPVEVPAFLMPYLQRLSVYRDQTAGQSGIMRGEIPQGANVAAGAVNAMQGAANARPAMEAAYISAAMREMGTKIFWLQRETYRTGLVATIRMPATGEEVEVAWDEEKIGNDFFVDVDIAANAPGGQQMLIDQTIKLYKEKIVPRSYVLATIGIEGWEQLEAEMKKQEQDAITAQAFGRAFGVAVKQAQKTDGNRGPVGN